MNITKIELINFRCYKKKIFENISNINIFIGSNGIGKTSILEAIYFTSICKSFKTNEEETIIKKGEISLKTKVKIYNNKSYKNLEIKIYNNKRFVYINNTIQKKLSDYISQYTVILFSPDEIKLIKSSPNVRRNYLNIQISQIDKKYLKILSEYNQLIKDKNNYLKKFIKNENSILLLDIIDKKISEIGSKIYDYRKKYIDNINKTINNYFTKFKSSDSIGIKYSSDFDSNIENNYKILLKNRDKDIYNTFSTIGIHKDDFIFFHNDINCKEYSSQGTQRLIILSLKLAEVDLFEKYYNIKPIILLDDIFSELDITNRNIIFELLKKDNQFFITTTDLKNIKQSLIKKAKIYDLNERN